jgi:tetratricopeptide (TPR) repeat protein
MPAQDRTEKNGHSDQQLEPWQKFKGREDILTALMMAWRKARQGDPQCAVLMADSGFGKTRLIHEFYRRISSEANGGKKGSGYWPDELSGDPTRIDPNPDFEDFEPVDEIPWLWWGMRWGCPMDRNQSQASGCGVVEWTNHLERHVAGLINRKAAKKVAREALVGALDAVMDFLPIPNVVGMLDTANNCREWVKEIVEIRQNQTEKFDQKKKTEEKALQAIGFLRAFLDSHEKNAATVPVILVLDDAQWADPISLKFVAQLFARAVAEQWPLLILVTHWETEWHSAGAQKAPEQDAPLDQWNNFRRVEASIMGRGHAGGSFRLHPLGKVSDDSIRELLRSKFPGLGDDDTGYVVKRCDGNPLALEEFIKVMQNECQWFEAGDIALGIDPDYRDDFHGKTLDSENRADKRFMQIAQSNPGLYEFLKLGAVQGITFYHDLLTDLAIELKKGDHQWIEQLIPLAENPHCIVDNLTTQFSSSEFRRALYRDGLQKRMKKEWRGYITSLKTVLNRWWNQGKFPDKTAGIRLLELYAGVLLETESQEDRTRAAFVASRLSESLEELGDYTSALLWAERACHASDDVTGENAIWRWNRYATCLRLMGRFDEALNLAKTTLNQAEVELGPEHPATIGIIDNLAVLLSDTNRLSEAEKLYRQALAIHEKSLGPNHPDVAASLNNLAILLKETNRQVEAEPLFRRALAINEKSLGSDHPVFATSLNSLALLLAATSREAEAEPLLRRALTLWEKSLGPDHPNVAASVTNLANLLAATKRQAEAEPLLRRALAIKEKSLGSDHPAVSSSLNSLANVLCDTNRQAEAEPLYRKALAIDEQKFGSDHPLVAASMNNLARWLKENNRQAEAIPLYREALTIQEKCHGPNDPLVAESMTNLAALLSITNLRDEAEPLFRRALAIREKSLSTDEPAIANSLNNLAILLKDTNRPDEAELLFSRAREHPSVATMLNNLANSFVATNRLVEAEDLFRRALAIREKGLPSDNPLIAETLDDLANLLKQTRREAEAEPLLQQAQTIRDKTSIS